MSVEISSSIFVSVCKYRWYYAFSSRTSVELSIDILHLFATCRWKFPVTFFNFFFFKILMIFAFAFKTSVKLFIAKMSMELFIAKCRWKFPSTSFYLLRISMIFCFCLAKRRWKISSILCIYFQNVDGNFHRHFASISKSDSNLQGFQSNILG